MSKPADMSYDQAQAAMKAEGKTGEHITQDRAEAVIADEQYWRVPNTNTIVCCLILINGFTVIGTSACADPANFIETVGRDRARTKAKSQVFDHEAYVLCNDLMAKAAVAPITLPKDHPLLG